MNKGYNNSCSFNEQILEYVYDELSASGRDKFESHLEDCFACIDGLAEIADARYSVYEWKNVEFAPLPTPRIVIPTSVPEVRSWIETIKSAFTWNKGWAIAGGLAGLLLVMALGILFLPEGPGPAVAIAEPEVATEPLVQIPSIPDVLSRPELPDVNVQTVARPRATHGSVAVARRTAAVSSDRRRAVRAAAVAKSSPARGLRDSPTLGYYAEDNDETLRLTDLFEDLGTRELE